MDSRLLHSSSLSSDPCCFSVPRPRLLLPRATTDAEATDRAAESAAVPSSPTPPVLNIKYRSRSRVRRRQEEEEEQQQSASRKQPLPKKNWEAMTPGEKAVELYMGEKGLLFWLNKIAYTLIFVISGGNPLPLRRPCARPLPARLRSFVPFRHVQSLVLNQVRVFWNLVPQWVLEQLPNCMFQELCLGTGLEKNGEVDEQMDKNIWHEA